MGSGSSKQLHLFKMKQIYVCEIHENKIEFLQGDHRTSTTTFYFDDDIKSKCFEIFTKLNTLNNDLDVVNIYHDNNKIYVIGEDNDLSNHLSNHLSNKIIPTINGYYIN
jgi:hypothetical protein